MTEAGNDAMRTVAENALDEWDLDVTKIELIAQVENIVYRLDTVTGKTYTLRIHRPGYHTLAELHAEQQWTAALDQAGIAVPLPKMTKEGAGYAEVPLPNSNETRYVGIAEWLDDILLPEILKQTTDKTERAQYFHQLGQSAAKIHNQAVNWQIPKGFQRHSFDADGVMGNAPFWGRFWEIPQLTDAERQRILDIRSAIHRILSDYGKHQGTYSMIHADLHPGNLLVNGNQLAIIDFDDAGFGWHQYELVAALFYYWNKPDFNTVHDALIAGYRTERTFDDTAIELLPMFLVIRALALLGWIHDRPELDNSHRLPGLIAIACDLADDLGLGL